MSEGKNILIIDDEEVIHLSLSRILLKQGFQIDSAMTAWEAIEKLKQKSYDLLITDLMMPEMNGIDLLKELQKMEVNIPSIMITGYPTIRTAVQALRLGATDYISKPFTRQEILAPVCRALRRDSFEACMIPVLNNELSSKGHPDANIVIMPGERFSLLAHSWAVYQKDGTVLVGIAKSFLQTAGKMEKVFIPAVNDLLEQGYVAVTITTDNGEVHNVFSPITGRIMEVNDKAFDPQYLDGDTWVLRVLPSQLKEDIRMLVKQEPLS